MKSLKQILLEGSNRIQLNESDRTHIDGVEMFIYYKLDKDFIYEDVDLFNEFMEEDGADLIDEKTAKKLIQKFKKGYNIIIPKGTLIEITGANYHYYYVKLVKEKLEFVIAKDMFEEFVDCFEYDLEEEVYVEY